MSNANESSTAMSDSDQTDEVAAEAPEQPQKPLLRVVKGDPTAEELAALIAVVAARAAAVAPPKKPLRSEWGHPARGVRGVHRPGPDAWRRSAWA